MSILNKPFARKTYKMVFKTHVKYTNILQRQTKTTNINQEKSHKESMSKFQLLKKININRVTIISFPKREIFKKSLMKYLYIPFFLSQITLTKFVKRLIRKSKVEKVDLYSKIMHNNLTYRLQTNQKQNENKYWGNKQVIHQLHKVIEIAHKSS